MLCFGTWALWSIVLVHDFVHFGWRPFLHGPSTPITRPSQLDNSTTRLDQIETISTHSSRSIYPKERHTLHRHNDFNIRAFIVVHLLCVSRMHSDNQFETTQAPKAIDHHMWWRLMSPTLTAMWGGRESRGLRWGRLKSIDHNSTTIWHVMELRRNGAGRRSCLDLYDTRSLCIIYYVVYNIHNDRVT